MVSIGNNHMNVDGEATVHVDVSLKADDSILSYIKFKHFRSLLQDGLYIVKADSFVKGKDGDPFEEEYTELFYQCMSFVWTEKNGKKETGKDIITRDLSITRSLVFANCWALSESESVAMWKLFGKEINSIAIQT